MAAGIRLTYEEVKETFATAGCELLESEYKNARTKLRYRCSCGREAKIVLYSFKNGNRCRFCGGKTTAQKQTLTQEQAAAKFAELGMELLSPYERSSKKVRFRCHCGREAESLPNTVWRSKRCARCGTEARSGSNHYDWRDDRDQLNEEYMFRQRSYKLIKMSLAKTGAYKTSRSSDILGYSWRQLQDHIAAHPDWEYLKMTSWHVDHIFPIKAFMDYGVFDLKVINALDNLRPLAGSENCRKGGKYDQEAFLAYLKTKGIEINGDATPHYGV